MEPNFDLRVKSDRLYFCNNEQKPRSQHVFLIQILIQIFDMALLGVSPVPLYALVNLWYQYKMKEHVQQKWY
jgi:hypothetical protein